MPRLVAQDLTIDEFQVIKNHGQASGLPSEAAKVVSLLGLIPHPEGGFFLETWRYEGISLT